MHPIWLQLSPPHGKLTICVGSALHPHGLFNVCVVVHCGIRHWRHAVAVCVMVGHSTAGPHACVLVDTLSSVTVVVATCRTVDTAVVVVTVLRTTVAVEVTLTVSWRMYEAVEVVVTVSRTICVTVTVRAAPGREIVDGVRVIPWAATWLRLC